MYSLQALADDWRAQLGRDTAIGSNGFYLLPTSIQNTYDSHGIHHQQTVQRTGRSHAIGEHFTWSEGKAIKPPSKPTQWHGILSLCTDHLLCISRLAIQQGLAHHDWQSNAMIRFQMGQACHRHACLQAMRKNHGPTPTLGMILGEIEPMLSTLAVLEGAKGLLANGLREIHWFAIHLIGLVQHAGAMDD